MLLVALKRLYFCICPIDFTSVYVQFRFIFLLSAETVNIHSILWQGDSQQNSAAFKELPPLLVKLDLLKFPNFALQLNYLFFSLPFCRQLTNIAESVVAFLVSRMSIPHLRRTTMYSRAFSLLKL